VVKQDFTFLTLASV